MKYRKKDWESYVFDFSFMEDEIREAKEKWNKIWELSKEININKSFWKIDLEKEKFLENLKIEFKDFQAKFQKILKEKNIDQRNILRFSNNKDIWIWKWKDSKVFEMQKIWNYVYKESHNWNLENLEYVKNKYMILKKYLWDIIPKSYFVFWELESSSLWSPLKDYKKKVITLQQKVNWKDFSKLSFEEKKDEKLLLELEKAHKKYILLKYFLSAKIDELNLSKKTMDVQLDLWSLSDKDNFSSDDVNFLKNWLKSPNIMWDEKSKKIFFIDFWSWEWSEDKKQILNYMMKDEVFESWKNILKSYNLDL